MSNGFIRLCSMVFCWAAISACHALLSSHMTNKDDDDDDDDDDEKSFAAHMPLLTATGAFRLRRSINQIHIKIILR